MDDVREEGVICG